MDEGKTKVHSSNVEPIDVISEDSMETSGRHGKRVSKKYPLHSHWDAGKEHFLIECYKKSNNFAKMRDSFR